jgi:hypothetical protein
MTEVKEHCRHYVAKRIAELLNDACKPNFHWETASNIYRIGMTILPWMEMIPLKRTQQMLCHQSSDSQFPEVDDTFTPDVNDDAYLKRRLQEDVENRKVMKQI